MVIRKGRKRVVEVIAGAQGRSGAAYQGLHSRCEVCAFHDRQHWFVRSEVIRPIMVFQRAACCSTSLRKSWKTCKHQKC